MGRIMDFLFGKNPDIFDNKGRVRHHLPKDLWEDWQNRYTSDPSYNWRNHTGTKAKGLRQQKRKH